MGIFEKFYSLFISCFLCFCVYSQGYIFSNSNTYEFNSSNNQFYFSYNIGGVVFSSYKKDEVILTQGVLQTSVKPFSYSIAEIINNTPGQKIKSELVECITLGENIFDLIDNMPLKDAERYILDLASIFLISDAVTDKKLFKKFNALSRKSDRIEQKEILSINAKETTDLWQGISTDLKFKKEDLEEIFAFNPHYFDSDAIIALLGSTSGYSFGL